MSQRLAPHVVLYGPRQPETVLAAMENFVSWEALRLSWDARIRLIPISIKILSKR